MMNDATNAGRSDTGRANSGRSNLNLLEGPVTKNLIRFAVPIAATSILQQLFNSADTAVVGRFSSTSALAAVGTNAEIVALLVSLSSGFAVGLNVLLAWKIGQGKRDEINRILHGGLGLSLLLGVAMMVLVLLWSEPLLRLIQTPEEAFRQAVLYLRLYAAGLPFLLLYDFACAVERARGNSRRPMVVLLFSGVLNVGLNLLFVLACGMDVAGVALATDLSTACSAFLTLRWLAADTDAAFRFSLRRVCLDRRSLPSVLRIGTPAALQGAVFCFANIFVQAAVNSFGAAATAGAAAAMNFEYITYYMITAFTQTVTTFTSQNQAAGNHERCLRILKQSLLLALLSSAALSTPLTVWAWQASSFFSHDPAVLQAACERIRLILVFTPVCSFYEIPAGFLRGYGFSLLPALETIVGTCLFRILWIFTGFQAAPSLPMLYVIFPVSWVVTILLLGISTGKLLRRLPRPVWQAEKVRNTPPISHQ
ncbi:MAG: Putative efflux protein MATE family [Succiniclasticum sp.]|jgi:putative MATE family efflux protein